MRSEVLTSFSWARSRRYAIMPPKQVTRMTPRPPYSSSSASTGRYAHSSSWLLSSASEALQHSASLLSQRLEEHTQNSRISKRIFAHLQLEHGGFGGHRCFLQQPLAFTPPAVRSCSSRFYNWESILGWHPSRRKSATATNTAMSFRYETVEEFAAQTERLVAEHPTRVMQCCPFPASITCSARGYTGGFCAAGASGGEVQQQQGRAEAAGHGRRCGNVLLAFWLFGRTCVAHAEDLCVCAAGAIRACNVPPIATRTSRRLTAS